MKSKIHMLQPIFILIITLFSACNQETIETSTNQEILFEVNHVNFAWGKQFRGLLIDKNGQIMTYDNPVKWNLIDGKDGLTLNQIKENISNTVISKTKVSAADLQNYASKMNAMASQDFTKPVSGGADRGITSFYAYRYDADKQIYTPVLLSQIGDLETYNTDKSAVEISSWLKEILAKVF